VTRPPLRLSLFWRTFALIALVVAVSLLAWLQLFRATEFRPRAERVAWEIASVVNLTRAALVSAEGPRRLELLQDLAGDEGIGLLPAEPSDRVQGWPDERFGMLFESKLRELLGGPTRVASAVNDEPGLWIRFEIDGDPYWMRLEPERVARQAGRNWLGWIGIAIGLATLAALSISRAVNRPLVRLAEAIDRVSRGEPPARLAESAATEMAEVNRRFNQLALDLAALEQDRAEALAGISHDIRTPLTRLRMEIEMSGADPATRASMADEIDRIDAIVRQFVDFARPEDSGPVREVDLDAVLSSALDAYRSGATGAQISVRCAIEPGTRWRGSPTTLARILSNLVENACRYGSDPDGRVRIEVDARRAGSQLELTVRDHGPGVAPSQLTRLLRPFTRLDSERNRHGGSGLGLSIVSRLARRHRGELRLELPADGGLRARVTLADAG
jgi:two-component system osmolarity sensor histidine kinase EnvZ